MLETIKKQFKNIIVLDTETTGIDCKSNEIIELAAIRAELENGEYVEKESFDLLIRLSGGKRLPAEIVRLTGITDDMLLSEGVEKEEAGRRFAGMLSHENTLIAAYNAQFDMCFLFYFLFRLGLSDALKGNRMLDLLTVYKDRQPYPHKLSDAVEKYSLTAQNTHRAIDDTRAAFELMHKLSMERDDLDRYINLFGYNPKYGISGPKISSITYKEQGYRRTEPLYN